jgi:excisionase family DNA binding protein
MRNSIKNMNQKIEMFHVKHIKEKLRRTKEYAANPEFRKNLREKVLEEFMLTRTQEAPERDKLLTPLEVAKQLGVDRSTVRRWLHAGALPGVRLPTGSEYITLWRVYQSEVDKILKKEGVYDDPSF